MPHYPGESSGITIGIGYDLRFAGDEAAFHAVWGPHLPATALQHLTNDLGRRGSQRRARELAGLGIEVPFAVAWTVFIQQMLPDHHGRTETTYPQLPQLPDLCRSVLVSLVLNRGPRIDRSDRRREMLAIRDILRRASVAGLYREQQRIILAEVADQLLSMRRLWASGSGLVRRRQSEAKLWRQGLREWSSAHVADV